MYFGAACGATLKHKQVCVKLLKYRFNAWVSLTFGAVYIVGGTGSCFPLLRCLRYSTMKLFHVFEIS